MKFNLKDEWLPEYAYYLIIFCFFAISVSIMQPFGEYLVDDEWAFVKSVEHLFFDNRLKILDWNPMSLIFQTFLGTIASYIFGFSFTALKVLTLLIGFTGIASFFCLLTELGLNRQTGLLASLLFIYNPIYFFHCFTFMTDVPFLTFLIISMLLYHKGRKQESLILLFAGSLFATFSLLIRQHGFLIPISVTLYYIANLKYEEWLIKKIAAVLILPLLSFLIFEYWYFFIHGQTIMYAWQQEYFFSLLRNPKILLSTIPHRLAGVFIYFGFFTIPLSLSFLPNLHSLRLDSMKFKIAFYVTSLSLFIWVIWKFISNNQIMPYFTNKLTSYGIMSPNELLFGNRNIIISRNLWIVLTALSLISIICCLYLVFCRMEAKKFGMKTLISSKYSILFSIGIVQLIYLFMFSKIFFDRHLIILIPFILITLLVSSKDLKINKILVSILILPYIGLSLISTSEVNNFSRAIWKAGTYLKSTNVLLRDIDGGYAWNGWNMFEFSMKYGINRSRKRDPWWIKNIAPAINSNYLLSLSPKIDSKEFSYINDEYVVSDKFEYKSFLNNPSYVYVLHRK